MLGRKSRGDGEEKKKDTQLRKVKGRELDTKSGD